MSYEHLVGQKVKLEWFIPAEMTPEKKGPVVFTEHGLLRGIENGTVYLHTDRENTPLQPYPLSAVWDINLLEEEEQ